MTTARTGAVTRRTNETTVSCTLTLDGRGGAEVRTGLGFLDHMVTALARHWRIDLKLEASGDLQVDDHHTVEDAAIAIGRALDQALGERRGVERFGWAYAPLDEALARAVVDLSGRAAPCVNLGLRRERLGEVSCENLTHFLVTLAGNARCALHVDVLRGENDHHRAEAAFKAVALALRAAVAVVPGETEVASTKGVLS